MKYRSDFVTNSSSSSFVAYGVDVDNVKNKSEFEKLQDKWGDFDHPILSKGGPYDGYQVIGITPEGLRKHFADAKIGDIPQIVADELNKALGTEFTIKDITYYEEGWYNG